MTDRVTPKTEIVPAGSSTGNPVSFPSAEKIARELATAKSPEDFFGKDGIFSRLFARTMEQMLEAELTDHLGYEKYEAKGRNSGNSRNGKVTRTIRSSAGETPIAVPRDRNGEFEPTLLKKYGHNTSELEEKILGLYGKGLSTRDLHDTLQDLYGIEVSAATISAITEKIWPTIEAWQNRPLLRVYPIVYLDAIHVKLRREGRVENVAVYNILAVDPEGQKDVRIY